MGDKRGNETDGQSGRGAEGAGTGGGVDCVVQRHLVRLLRGPDSLTFTGPLLGLSLASSSREGLGVWT